ncbi:hypothetical protein F4561_002637 [Lipingzhangella halophila]|uniref:Uncharacterized protein n=1 Tax=Lipingzhangella halophila TaxID=1783352 RepID=A0A7W7RH13_9ACTN|nr:hypothetical protein [Lipingzhangella halophila]MBB4931817.1 hypothetical protein [Lipingzhangella halophila]
MNEQVAKLRNDLRGLLADVETVDRPAPTRRTDNGPEWEISETLPRPAVWRVRASDTDGGLIQWQLPECEQISTATLPGDWVALAVPDARRIAVALLAACDWAEECEAGVTHLRPREDGVTP